MSIVREGSQSGGKFLMFPHLLSASAFGIGIVKRIESDDLQFFKMREIWGVGGEEGVGYYFDGFVRSMVWMM